MTEEIIAAMLKAGFISFVGSRIMKSLGQKEISEIISASGWCIIGIHGATLIIRAANWVNGILIKGQAFGDKIEYIFDKINIFN